MFKNKKAFITSPADMAKGLLVGLIIGAIIAYLIFTGVIPLQIGGGGGGT